MGTNLGSIAENLRQVRHRIDRACTECNRSPQHVTLLAVSKTCPADAVRAAVAAGQRAFGENYVQEALVKIEALTDVRAQLEWHLIGPLQSNKTRVVAEAFDWVHTVDRLKIAERLAAQRPENLPPLNICLQVNVDGEASKSGVSFDDLPALARAVAILPGLRLRGLMSIPEPVDGMAAQRAPHRRLREAFMALREQQGLALDTLSMGMSADLEAAVLEGATLVRVGSAIFGARSQAASRL
ncbi:MAG TPA: YggS family pyridoxal phosphate-dependent enzyme [Ideonella sp.]|uniref:YggS family pyridoxal phosphate-dependent enzyme n=1 Tax=Ideonella sp. TaxID=1929293 RepID=UPI002E315904|nr:YggS family pyridoxal phosphate-dependent enzyme [Ideonella sp.]HEX5684691.1 YggS family pyridoxal phosphate-dependent enzyme [Ideonella sp.]